VTGACLQVTAAIVTCGGLCPGLNDVVAGIVNKLTDYGVPEGKILGIKYGFRCAGGLQKLALQPVLLDSRQLARAMRAQAGKKLWRRAFW
jgi:6-phosphofructokinase 1